MAILCVNRLNFPIEIIDIIKGFTFYDIETANLRNLKNLNLISIECAMTNKNLNFYSDRYSLYDYLFKVEGEIKFIYCIFCKKCGNYIESFTVSRFHKTMCQC